MRYSNEAPSEIRSPWSWARVWALCRKEWADLYHNKRILFLTFLLPLTLLALPLMGLWAVAIAPEAELQMEAASLIQTAGQEELGVREQLQITLATQFLTLFLLAPLTIPVSTAAYSVVGEKRERSLEPLLATPLHTGEIIAAKAIGSVLPGLGASVLTYAMYAAVARWLIQSDRVYELVLGILPLLVMGILAPLLSMLGVLLALVVSARANDPRTAEQVSLTLVLPLIALFVLQVFGFFQLTPGVILVSAVGLILLILLVLRLAVYAFSRGTILNRL